MGRVSAHLLNVWWEAACSTCKDQVIILWFSVQRCSLFSHSTLVMGGCLSFYHIMMQVWCWECSAVPSCQILFWKSYLYVGCCFLYSFFLSGSKMKQWWWKGFLSIFQHHDATLMLGGLLSVSHHDATLMTGFVFCCAPGPVCFRWGYLWWMFFLCVFFSTSRCNSDAERISFSPASWYYSGEMSVMLCLWARCVLIYWCKIMQNTPCIRFAFNACERLSFF